MIQAPQQTYHVAPPGLFKIVLGAAMIMVLAWLHGMQPSLASTATAD